ncbi:MAG: hypothetical protein CMJ18_11045 [Phycisphaeraceae bacterium]|nr:hypothetical protein [Phycisphaeraceae bacterium]
MSNPIDERPRPADPPGDAAKVGGGSGGDDAAARGWASRLAGFVTAFLVIESLTGLWIYLAPFSVASQIQVLVHTAAGLVLLIPYLYYQARHLVVWFHQKPTAVMFLGYALMVMVLACSLSGVVLTWEAAVGPKRSPGWNLVHVVSGIAAFFLVVAHVLAAFLRRRMVARRSPELALAIRRFALRSAVWVGCATAIIAVTVYSWPLSTVEYAPPDDYTLLADLQQFDEYRGSPFAPTYARTSSRKLVNPEVLSNSRSCGSAGCHEQILAEWNPSAHRFSAMNPPFQQVQKNFAADRDPAHTRYCAGCHDPISLFAGAKDASNLDLSAPGMQEGNSCVVCHSISSVDQRGNADYVLTPPHKYIWEHEEGWKKAVSDFLIRAYPTQHLADYDRNVLRSPEYCGACHKQFIPEALNRFGLSPGQNQYDEWRKSHWHVDDASKDLSCRDCHMRLVPGSTDPGRGEGADVRRTPDDGAHRHHGMVATNMFMPAVLKLPNWRKHVELTEEWIRGETVVPEIAHLWPTGPVASVQVIGPEQVRPGEQVTLRVMVTNRKAGHNFTTGPLDFTRAWVHLRVFDASGKSVAEWGNIDPSTRRICDVPGKPHEVGNSRDSGTLVLEALPLDGQGNPLNRHELWNKAGGTGQRVIFARHSDSQTYRFEVPRSAVGPLTVKADLNFRRYRQEFLDLVVPEMEERSGVYQPTVPHDSVQKRIAVTLGAVSRARHDGKER